MEMIAVTSLLIALLAQPAQQVPSPPQQTQPTPPPVISEEVVVTGLRDLDDPHSPVTKDTLASGYNGAGPVASRNVFAYSQRFAKCAMQRSSANLTMLRRALDTRINSSAQDFAYRRLIQMHPGCVQDPEGARAEPARPAPVTIYYDGVYYDRGALFLEALKTFAPDLKLTKAQTADPIVQARFNAREVPLAKFRIPTDRSYFEAAICMVRMQPELAVRLVKTEKPQDAVNRLEAAIVNGARPCIGGARHYYFDATQFRFYIADAVYRWAVAAQNVPSLIPAT